MPVEGVWLANLKGAVNARCWQPLGERSSPLTSGDPAGQPEVSCDLASGCRQLLSRPLFLAVGFGSVNANVTNVKIDYPAFKMQH